jgi:acyl carrier protein
MEREKFLVLLDEAFELPEGTLKGPELVEDFGNWDSLRMMSVIALVDEHYNITLSPRQFLKCNTIDDLLELTRTSA